MPFFYTGGCRQQYMRVHPGGRYYLHPSPRAKASIYVKKDKQKEALDHQKSMRGFALAIWRHWFSRLPVFRDVIHKDNTGIFYNTSLGVPAAHFLMGMIRQHGSIMGVIKTPIEDWGINELALAMRIGQAQTTKLDQRPNQNRSTLARMCIIMSDVVRPSSGVGKNRAFNVTTDAIVPAKGAKIMVPPELKPLFDFHDFEYLRLHGVKTSQLIDAAPVWIELVDSRFKFLSTENEVYTIRAGQIVPIKDAKTWDKKRKNVQAEMEAEDEKDFNEWSKREEARDKIRVERRKKLEAAKKKKEEEEKKAEAAKQQATEVNKAGKVIVNPKKKPAAKKPAAKKIPTVIQGGGKLGAAVMMPAPKVVKSKKTVAPKVAKPKKTAVKKKPTLKKETVA